MKTLLEELAKSKLVKVTGSYADGTATICSDIDFYLKPDHPEQRFYGKERNILKIINILKKHNISWNSNLPGYIYTHKSNNDLEIQIEFSDMFKKRKNKLPSVEIMGVVFKTY